MWGELWSVLGPLVGVGVGGLVTWWTQRGLTARQEEAAAARSLLERRQAAYEKFFATATTASLYRAMFLASTASLEEFRGSVVASEVALAGVKFIAPPDTSVAAHRLNEAAYLAEAGASETERAENAAELTAALDEFLRLARRDVGAGAPATGPAPVHLWVAKKDVGGGPASESPDR